MKSQDETNISEGFETNTSYAEQLQLASDVAHNETKQMEEELFGESELEQLGTPTYEEENNVTEELYQDPQKDLAVVKWGEEPQSETFILSNEHHTGDEVSYRNRVIRDENNEIMYQLEEERTSSENSEMDVTRSTYDSNKGPFSVETPKDFEKVWDTLKGKDSVIPQEQNLDYN